MDLPIKHEAFAGRGLAVRTAGFFKGPRLMIDGGEVKGKRLRPMASTPFRRSRSGAKRSSWPGRSLGTNTCGWGSPLPLSSSAVAWVHYLALPRSTRAPGFFEAIVARPPNTVSAR